VVAKVGLLQSLNRAWACSDDFMHIAPIPVLPVLQSLNRAWACSDLKAGTGLVVYHGVAIPQSGVGLF